MTPEQIETYAYARLDEHDLRRWNFRWNTTSKRTAGWCKPAERVIEVAEWVVEHDWPADEIKDLVLHEVAHAIVRVHRGGRASSHGEKWKKAAAEIGADPTRCYSGDLSTPDKLWRQFHPECGWERRLHRLSRGGSCPRCSGGVFKPEFLPHIEASDGRAVTASRVLGTYTRYDMLDRLPPGTEGV